MIDEKKYLEGSKNRDKFKQLHKTQLDGSFYALDIDFALIAKNEGRFSDALPMIVAIIDFKMPNDSPTFSEVLAYNQFKDMNIPVYLIEALNKPFAELEPEKHRFRIKEYISGKWKPSYVPTDTEVIAEAVSWEELEEWEKEVRESRKKQRRERYSQLSSETEIEIDGGTITDYSLLSAVKEEVKSRPSLVEELM